MQLHEASLTAPMRMVIHREQRHERQNIAVFHIPVIYLLHQTGAAGAVPASGASLGTVPLDTDANHINR